MNKKVLFISHIFPPDAGGGVYRIVKFCKYLPQCGWLPLVLTTKGGYYLQQDESLLTDIPPEVEVKRTISLEPGRRSLQLSTGSQQETPTTSSRWIKLSKWLISKAVDFLNNWFFIPDKSIGWIFFAEIAGGWLMRKKKIDLIFVSGNPFSSFLIANQLKRWSGIPYVLDLRDSWTLDPYRKKPSLLKRKIEQSLEKRLLREASVVVMATERMQEDYSQEYPKLKDKFHTVTNGYDEDDLKGIKPIIEKKFTISHIGSLDKAFQRPEFFLQAFKNVIEEKDEYKKNIQLLFMGTFKAQLIQIIENLGLKGNIKLVDYTPHKTALNYMAGADVLLLICGGKGLYHTGKVFEYLAMDKSILALTHPEGAAAEIVKQSHPSSVICSPQDVDQIALSIKKLYQKWCRKELKPVASRTKRKQFSRLELTRKLAKIFDEISQKEQQL